MTGHILQALSLLVEWPNPLYIIGGILFGMLIGFLPGMAGSVALALLIPLSYQMRPEVAVLFLIAAYSPAGFGGMLTSILVNTPGAPENAATTFDGYPMAKQGRAGAAIGAATAASVIGGLLGTLVLIALIPVASKFVLAFSYPEFFMMAIFGLTTIAVITDRNTFKGLMAAALGFMVAFIGLDPIVGAARFTFGSFYLSDGIGQVPVLIGLFAGAEVLALFGRGTSVAADAVVDPRQGDRKRDGLTGPVTFWDGVRETFAYKWLIVRCSAIGTVIGIVPGVGGAVSSFVAYSHARQTSKHPQMFGKGAIDGVIASESANDAKEGGSLLPTIAFGIPGTVGMAILLGALILQGVPAGPSLLIDHVDIIYTLIIGMVVAKFIAPIVVWLVSKQSARLTRLRPGVFTPLIVVAALVGTFTVNVQILDLVVALVFAYVGYAMRRYGFSRVAFIIAFVLGELVERSYYQTLGAFGSPTVIARRPISGTLLALTVIVVGFAVYKGIKRIITRTEVAEEDDQDVLAAGAIQPGRVLFDLIGLGFTVTLVFLANSIDSDARVMPHLIGWPLTVALALQLLFDLWPSGPRHIRGLLRHRRGTPPAAEHASAAAGGAPASGPPVPHEGALATAGSEIPAADGTGEWAARPLTVSAPTLTEPAPTEVPMTTATKERSPREILWRQAAFSVWACAFVALSAFVGFIISIPVSLFVFLWVLAREKWWVSAVISLVALGAFYGLFDLALGVSLG